MRLNVDQIIAFLLLVGSGFYLAGITPYSPIYIMFGLAVILFIIRQVTRLNISSSVLAMFNLLLCAYFFTTQLTFTNAKFPNVMGLALPYIFFFLGVQVFRYVRTEKLLASISTMTWVSIAIFVVDAAVRFSNPTYSRPNPFTGEINILPLASRYKFNSIMYLDANFTGIQVVILYFFLTYLQKENLKFPFIKFARICAAICVVLSTSRSAMIGLVVYHLVFSRISFPFKLTPRIIIASLAALVIMLVSGFVVLRIFKDDGSFMSKFEILDLAMTFVMNGMKPINWVFGLGAGEAASFIGIGAHNIAVTFILETGFAGTGLFLINMIWISRKTKGKSLYLLLPFITMGFSLISLAIPFLMIQLAFIYIMEMRNAGEMAVSETERA